MARVIEHYAQSPLNSPVRALRGDRRRSASEHDMGRDAHGYQAVQPPLEMTYPGGGRGGTQVSGDWTWTPSRYAQANQFRARGAQSLCQSSGGTHFGPYG